MGHTSAGGGTAVLPLRRMASGKSLLWQQKYNLLDNSCKAGRYVPGHFIAPNIRRQSAMRGNAQHKTGWCDTSGLPELRKYVCLDFITPASIFSWGTEICATKYPAVGYVRGNFIQINGIESQIFYVIVICDFGHFVIEWLGL